jgi:hypothetical protein
VDQCHRHIWRDHKSWPELEEMERRAAMAEIAEKILILGEILLDNFLNLLKKF